MNKLPAFPAAVSDYVRTIFAEANRRICQRIARVPSTAEDALDQALIDVLADYEAPSVVAPGWAVRIDVHFLGGRRHFYSWEIADIGVLILAKRKTQVEAKKVALLQSKRLYPDGGPVTEEDPSDYAMGFGRLLPDEPSAPSLALRHTFKFTKDSRYRALNAGGGQVELIKQYEEERKLPVHYLLYNPASIPATYEYPMVVKPAMGACGNGGCRVIPSAAIRGALDGKTKSYRPAFRDFREATPGHEHGWPLEYFMADLVMTCKEGRLFESLKNEDIYTLFNRRSGPMSAAIAVTIEQFSGGD
jgi:hypothetical protein